MTTHRTVEVERRAVVARVPAPATPVPSGGRNHLSHIALVGNC